MNWFCPNCLFEVPSSTVKSEGNRCTRNCYNCPICTAPLSVNGLHQEPSSYLTPKDAAQPSGPYFLACPYCNWTTLDIGIQFDKPHKITEQLSRTKNGGRVVSSPRDPEKQRMGSLSRDTPPTKLQEPPDTSPQEPPDSDELFSNLAAFYKNQLGEASGTDQLGVGYTEYGYGSPSNLARIMNMYGGLSYTALKKSRKKPAPMREAQDTNEGLHLVSSTSEAATIRRLRDQGWDGTTNAEQRLAIPTNNDARFTDDLRPVATLLPTKRTKRCRTCRHILAKLESKLHSTRYKIRLLALNYIPTITLRGLLDVPSSIPTALTLPSSPSTTTSAAFDYQTLSPTTPTQFLLTLRNPLFDPIRVTLATPATPSQRPAGKVTILCPQFDVGANTDVWDEALTDSTSGKDKSGRQGGVKDAGSGGASVGGEVAEAGKVWERGRNWTSVIVEVVPGTAGSRDAGREYSFGGEEVKPGDGDEEGGEDADVLEIPLFVRVEYETDAAAEDSGVVAKIGREGVEKRVKRELAYWCVLGVGRVAG
ncbi:hypothetical protein B0A49_02115 [Cryomyces minteri]|uniref:Dynactin subunit 4 n=1 Tax=Cryomyces minteri TaxID=331657 RepID=A0A4U0XLF6_9PEZI|nr:hypothetical protein B0A49_02115 [Cryomyces minteri]